MSARDQFDRRLAAWMAETASGPPPAGRFEQAVEATARRRPRPRRLAAFGSDRVGTAERRRFEWARPDLRRELVVAIIVALLIVAAIVGAAVVGAQLQRADPIRWRLGGLAYSVDGDIYVASAEGESPVLIAGGTPDSSGHATSSYWDPQWSRDGRYLMFQDSNAIAQEVHVVDPQGRPVASFPGWFSSWAPDSSRIATWEQAVDRVDVRAPDGRLVTTVAIPPQLQGAGDQRPEWSPDGRNVRMVRSWMDFPVDGRAPHPAEGYRPPGPYGAVWSPGGDRVAVTSQAAFGSIQVVNVMTGTATTIHASSAALATVADWSPDGQLVLVVEGNGYPGGASVWSVAADGSGGHVLVGRADQEGTDWRWVADDPR